jgi:uncharacterized membrane protein
VHRLHASRNVSADIDELYSWLSRVDHWPQFLEGLDSVEPLGYRRYRWTVTYARRTRTCDVVVSLDPLEHRIAWKHLNGAAFDGTIRLTPVRSGCTKVDLTLRIEPAGFLDGIVDSTGTTGWLAEHDLRQLGQLVADGVLRGVDERGNDEAAS